MKIELKNIICTTDFSDLSNIAIPFGTALAKEFGAKLYLCHVIDLSAVAMYGEGFLEPLERETRITDYAHDDLRRLIGDQPVDWEPLVPVGHTAGEIARLAEEKDADLVVSATQGRSGLKRLVLGSVTERLMRTLPCPLLVVRGPEQEQAASMDETVWFQRILVGCDFSSDSELTFQYGLSLAQEFQSEVHLAHVIEPAVYKDLLRPSIEEKEGFQQDLRKMLNDRLTGMVPEEVHNWCTPQTILLAGQPHEELTKYAVVHDVDLIVLGVRGHGLVETLFVGSTTDRVVREAPCPVLSVRPIEKSTQEAH
ncbi:MAG: universal stress protein [Desulfobacteraceae bacterium]|nr:universal stress protein [Desulfobacteraceae bacterium]